MKLEPGTMVTSNVSLVSLIGRGAMGDVWLADHLGLKTRVAVKFVSERVGPDDEEAMERFGREASLAAQIKSAHVVQKFDHGVMDDGTPYIVMEYLEGEQLGELLSRQPRLPLPQVAKIVHQTAKALQSAHKLGIVHRDIKPDNIFLSTRDDELHIKVFDFGVAKATLAAPVDEEAAPKKAELGITNDGVMIGTPEYMSPEQVMSAKAVDHTADLWALAVVAYVALTGELPFKAEDVGELCVKLLEGEFAPPSTLYTELPSEVDLWFATAFAKNRDERFESAKVMALSLEQLVPGTPPDPLSSGGYDAVPPPAGSMPSLQDVSERGARAATFSGASSDALALLTGRRRNSLIAAAAGAAVLAAALTAVMMSGDDDEPASAAPPTTTQAAAAAAPPAEDTAVAETTADDTASETVASASASQVAPSAAPPKLRPTKGKRWIDRRRSPARPKDPGF